MASLFDDQSTTNKQELVTTFAPSYAKGVDPLAPAWDPDRRDRCRAAVRRLYMEPLREPLDDSSACVSSNPKHVQAGYIRLLARYLPLAQLIVTIRPNGSVPTDRMLKTAGHLDIRLNQIAGGPRWNDKCNHNRQIAAFGVVEGDYKSHNSHMHLILLSRTQIIDDDMHELCFQLHSKKYVREFWYEQADLTKVGGYLKYILKGFHGRDGINVSDQFYDSKSLPRIR